MKEIVFNKDRSYLRTGIQKIEIEENPEFLNGLAIAKATIHSFFLEHHYSAYVPKTRIYLCEGLINTKYEEAFYAKYDTDIEKYLIFREENRHITRVGTDFIIETLENNKKGYTHLKVNGTKVELIQENLSNFTFTSFENLAIINSQFYFITANKYYGPKFKSLKEDPSRPGEFIVIDEIRILNQGNEYPLIDTIAFRMNHNFELKSFVYSLNEPGIPLDISSTNYVDLHKEREQQLLEKEIKFKETIDSLNDPFQMAHKQ